MTNCKFTNVDFEDFYPSISESLLAKSLYFAKRFVDISDDDISDILYCQKSFIFHEYWLKKTGQRNFDVTIANFDRADVFELVGLFLLKVHKRFIKEGDFGLYRDNGLGVYNTFEWTENR